MSPQQQQSPRILSPHGISRNTDFSILPPPSHIPQLMSSTLRTGPVFCPPQDMCNCQLPILNLVEHITSLVFLLIASTAIVLRILYGSITVHMESVECSEGTRIFYGPLHRRDVLSREKEERLFGPLQAHQVQLTPRHPAPIAKEMFDTIKRGLIFEVCTHSLCV